MSKNRFFLYQTLEMMQIEKNENYSNSLTLGIYRFFLNYSATQNFKEMKNRQKKKERKKKTKFLCVKPEKKGNKDQKQKYKTKNKKRKNGQNVKKLHWGKDRFLFRILPQLRRNIKGTFFIEISPI